MWKRHIRFLPTKTTKTRSKRTNPPRSVIGKGVVLAPSVNGSEQATSPNMTHQSSHAYIRMFTICLPLAEPTASPRHIRCKADAGLKSSCQQGGDNPFQGQ